MLFRATLESLDFGPGTESLEVRLMRRDEIPWHDIAFPVIAESLKLYYRDRDAGRFPLRSGHLERLPGPGRRYRTLLYDEA
jgi:hypothetical protein